MILHNTPPSSAFRLHAFIHPSLVAPLCTIFLSFIRTRLLSMRQQSLLKLHHMPVQAAPGRVLAAQNLFLLSPSSLQLSYLQSMTVLFDKQTLDMQDKMPCDEPASGGTSERLLLDPGSDIEPSCKVIVSQSLQNTWQATALNLDAKPIRTLGLNHHASSGCRDCDGLRNPGDLLTGSHDPLSLIVFDMVHCLVLPLRPLPDLDLASTPDHSNTH